MLSAPEVARDRATRQDPASGRSLLLDALATWLFSRLAVVVLTVAATWTVADEMAGAVPAFLSRWDRWDVGLFVKVARFGYQGYPQLYPDKGVVAFFPGEPLLLRLVHLAVPNWIAAGLLVSLVAGAVASVSLAGIAALDGGAVAASRAVLYLVVSPYAVFLFAGYSEALFLALALSSWLAARQGRWAVAGVLGGLAASVRITGVFLGAALLVQWVVDARGRRWRDVCALLLPWVVTAGYVVYLHAITGDWAAWQHAQAEQWGRRFTAPWTAFRTTWDAAGNPGQGAAYAWSFRAEIAAVVLGVLLTVVLLARRRWGEAVYVGGQVAVLATSSFYLSVARATLLWWPVWVLLASASLGRRWVHGLYLALAVPLAATMVVAFTLGHWVG
jgi:Mannosyltransferase (PIG-V)